jgi:hypothetical protein
MKKRVFPLETLFFAISIRSAGEWQFFTGGSFNF